MSTLSHNHEAVFNNTKRAFDDETFADIIIRLGTVELPAHSIILAHQSAYFARALKGGLGAAEGRELTFKEANSKEFTFEEGSMQAYWRLFEYMYTGEYSDEPSTKLDVLGMSHSAKRGHMLSFSQMTMSYQRMCECIS